MKFSFAFSLAMIVAISGFAADPSGFLVAETCDSFQSGEHNLAEVDVILPSFHPAGATMPFDAFTVKLLLKPQLSQVELKDPTLLKILSRFKEFNDGQKDAPEGSKVNRMIALLKQMQIEDETSSSSEDD